MSGPTAANTRWLSIQSAADILGLTPAALRKALDRRAMRTPDGGTEAELDGVRGRKFGRLWRVSLKGQTSTPKSGHEREVPIAKPLLALLEEAGPKAGRELVAKTSHGKPWREWGLLQAFRRAQEKAGIAGFRFHDLRHFFVTELFRRGGSAPAVQLLAGHLHLSTTQRYAHLVRNDLRATIGLLSGGRGNSGETAS